MKITDLVATTVAIPTEAPLRHSSGVHPGRLQRTLIELYTDEGLIGLGEVGGGDQRGKFEQVKARIIGEDPFHLERIRQKVLRQIYYLSNSRIYAAIELACLDIQGKVLNRPLCDLIGGPIRDKVPFSAYLFYRYRQGDKGGEETPAQMVEWTGQLIEKYGFKSAKLKAGVLPPQRDIEILYALRKTLGPDFGLRLDPNGVWSVGTAMRVAKALEDCDLEYLEDPTWGLAGMARVHEKTRTPLATNMCVTTFDDLPANEKASAVDIILSDIYYWEGITGVKNLARICETFRLGLSMHSGSEFGITLAAMVHTSATLPNLTYDVDAHYHHLIDDIIEGGPMVFKDGGLAVPAGPGLGVSLDRAKLKYYARYYEEQGDYYARYHEDTNRPEWFPVNPLW